LFGSTQYNTWAQQAYWDAMNLSPVTNGLLAALGWGLGGVAGHFGHVVEDRFGYRATFMGLWLAMGVAWLVAGVHLGWLGVFGLYLGTIAYAVGEPALQDAINTQVGSERRATVISAASLVIHMAFLPVAPLAGHVAQVYGVQASLLMLASFHLTCAGAVVVVMTAFKRRHSVP
jgi:hypothetical protein